MTEHRDPTRRLLDDVLASDLDAFRTEVRRRCHARIRDSRVGLLEDALAEDGADAWRTELHQALRARVARPHRRRRVLLAVAAVLLVALGTAALLRPSSSPPTREPETIVETRPPVAPSHVIRSRPLDAHQLIRTRAPLRVLARRSVQRVERKPKQRIVRLSNEELLAAMGTRPCALVRRGPAGLELRLLDPVDAARILRDAITPADPRDG